MLINNSRITGHVDQSSVPNIFTEYCCSPCRLISDYDSRLEEIFLQLIAV